MSVALPYLRFHLAVRPARSRGDRLSAGELTSQRLRRVLGKALLEMFCPFGEPRCQSSATASPRSFCSLVESCPFGVLYATRRGRRPPFAFHVFPSSSDSSVIELTLFGDAWRLYSWVLAALAEALREGLGKQRRRFGIEQVSVLHAEGPRWVCGEDLSQLSGRLEPQRLLLGGTLEGRGSPLGVEFLSPTRLMRDGELLPVGEPVAFDLLIARCLDRVEGLFGEAASDLLNPGARAEMVVAAAGVPLLRDGTRWVQQRDYSARHRQEFSLAGFTGRVMYGEPASRFLPLLRVAEVLHVGKNPTAGCGRLRVEPVVGNSV